MTQSLQALVRPTPFPDHMHLPESDGTFVKNFQEHPQSILLTDSIGPTLQQLHPDGQYTIGQDCGIYWRETEPPEKGAEAPDWFYVPNVPSKLDGQYRRSYVLWREFVAPLIVLEFASQDGTEERDATPLARTTDGISKPGKFWVYEQIMRIPYYGIYEIQTGKLEVYSLSEGRYQPLVANDRGHFTIASMGVEIGLWQGSYQNQESQLWLRWWDAEGNLLLIGDERARLEQQRTEQAQVEAAQERQRAEQAEAQLQQERQDSEQWRRSAIVNLLRVGLSTEQIVATLQASVAEIEHCAENL
jgi:Uma2 family endonuclease